jgi:hypothetical protein
MGIEEKEDDSGSGKCQMKCVFINKKRMGWGCLMRFFFICLILFFLRNDLFN